MNAPLQIKTLNNSQMALVDDLVQTYNIEPSDVIFFSDELKPILSYRANCAMCNQLLNPPDIDIFPVPSVSDDSISVKCTIKWDEKNKRSGVGVVYKEMEVDNELLSDSQIYELASSKAIRNCLKNSNVDLIALHNQLKSQILDFKPVKTAKASLLGHAHILGKEALLIQGENKSAWYLQIFKRYGVNSSSELSEDQLADFVAFLQTLVPIELAA